LPRSKLITTLIIVLCTICCTSTIAGSMDIPSRVQTSNFDFHTSDLCGEVFIGTEQALQQRTLQSLAVKTLMMTIIIMAALYPLALFIQHRSDHAPFWLALSCLSAAVYFFSVSGLIAQFVTSDLSWVFEVRIKLMFIALSWASTALLMFYHRNFTHIIREHWLILNRWITILSTVAIILTPAWILVSLTAAFLCYWVLQFLASLWILARALVDKRPYTIPTMIAFVPIFAAIPIEVISRIKFNSMPEVGIFCLIFFIVIESQIIARKFSNALNLADKLSKELQSEVALQTAVLNQKNKQLEHAHDALQTANHSLKRLSITDGLTQLHNRMHFEQEFDQEWRRSVRQNTCLSVLMIDVDYFKKLNDSAGHLVGDQALQLLAKELKLCFKRAGEFVARYGGEEFAVVLPNTDHRLALNSAETFRRMVEALCIAHDNKQYTMTVSIGVCSVVPSAEFSKEALLQTADCALYDAKNNGRNRVSIMPLFPSRSGHSKQQ
jgi:diguanylate cyclase (GGDEF)-like protein